MPRALPPPPHPHPHRRLLPLHPRRHAGAAAAPSKKNPVVLGCVAVSFAASWLCTVLPYVKTLSEGTRTILLTILIASAAALLFPVKDAPEQKEGSQDER